MLTDQETARIRKAAARADYCITAQTMKRFIQQHRKARQAGDDHTQEKIEYHLTYLNFHHECGLLSVGQYDELLKELKNW